MSLLRRDNELLRVAKQNLTNEKRLADWQEKRATLDVTSVLEDYTCPWWTEQDEAFKNEDNPL